MVTRELIPPLPVAARSAAPVAITAFGAEPDEATLFERHAASLGVQVSITAAPISEANAALADGRCVSVGHKSRVTAARLEALHRAGVRYLSTRSIGVDHIDVRAADRLGIRVEGSSYSPGSVADHTLMLMLMSLRGTASVLRRVASHDYRLEPSRGRELGELAVGVVGTGRIGAAVIQRLHGFGSRILTHDPRRPGRPLDELLEASDIVTLHAPLTPATHHLLDAARLARMRPGAVLINTARGALVDTDALLAALESGRLGGAALDVVEGEDGVFYSDRRGRPPGGRLERLHRLPNVIITPHTAYYTDRALADTVTESLRNCLRFEEQHRG
ncbi:MAG TPA: NAD(P)-dependent oxidoreductase [Rhodoglobus sp.]|nr:NAD(P)-dependent oxidoreductase [Rhodoglobus sp.]